MSQPADRPADRVSPVAPPPQEGALTQRIAEVLLAGYAAAQTADAITALLAPFKVHRAAVVAALGIASRSAHRARPQLSPAGIPARSAAAKIVRTAAGNDVYYRAAYIAAAAGRIERALAAGKTVEAAVADELGNFEAHRDARRKRLAAAAQTALAADTYGPLLGWYRNPLLDSDTDCIVADGHNFYAERGTIIGWPGGVHPRCGCSAGPPHLGAGMVDDVLGDVLGRLSPRSVPAKVLKLKKVAG